MRYRNAPIAEAVIDLRVATSTPVDPSVLDKIADELAPSFPARTPIRSLEIGFNFEANGPEDGVKSQQGTLGLRVADNSAKRILQLQRAGVTYSELSKYESWEDLRARFAPIWEAYARSIEPAALTRAAVRYVNKLQLPGGRIQLEDWFNLSPDYPEGLADEIDGLLMQVRFVSQADRIPYRCILNLFDTPNQTASTKVNEFVLDIDVYSQDEKLLKSEHLWNVLDSLSRAKTRIFESCITDRVRELIS